MPIPMPDASETEREQIRQHYAIEVELAQRLRESAPADRQRLYNEVYDELFRAVPWHVQHQRGADHRARVNARMRVFLRPWLHGEARVLEIGAGDGSFSLELAPTVARAWALDVSRGVLASDDPPPGFEFLLSDGVSIPLEDASVDLAFSNQLIEHVHPDDLQPHLREVRRVLRPGGRYVMITPHRLSGPHDISRFFDDTPRGFHLREYTCAELGRELRAAGFGTVHKLLKLKRKLALLPVGVPALLEWALQRGSRDWQRRLASRAPLSQLLAVRLVARRAS
jgi:SAM-dependent methyltransferase